MDAGEDSQIGPAIVPEIKTPAKGVQQPPKKRRNSLSPGSPGGSPGNNAKYTFKVIILSMLHTEKKDLLGTFDACTCFFAFIYAWHLVCRRVPYRHSGKIFPQQICRGTGDIEMPREAHEISRRFIGGTEGRGCPSLGRSCRCHRTWSHTSLGTSEACR